MCDTGKVDMKNVHSFIFGIDKNRWNIFFLELNHKINILPLRCHRHIDCMFPITNDSLKLCSHRILKI